jgi:hypothetical protein
MKGHLTGYAVKLSRFAAAMPSFYLTYQRTLPYYPPHAERT